MICKNTINDKIVAAQRGDVAALGMLFEWYRPALLTQALYICGNTPAAQDAIQDTFIAAFTHLHTLRDINLFYHWIKRILINNCYQLLRKKKFTILDEKLERSDSLINRSIDEHFERISNRQRLYEALYYLSDELRSCIMLRYFSKFNSYNEIALVLGIPVGTVRSRLSAAREKLSALYSQIHDAGDEMLKQAARWSGYYQHLWTNVYDDAGIRNELFGHVDTHVTIRYSSGKSGKGRKILERVVEDDLLYGSRFTSADVVSSGNISVIEGVNLNPPEYPDRCAPSSVFVLFRRNNKIGSFHIFDSARS